MSDIERFPKILRQLDLKDGIFILTWNSG